MLSFLKEHDVPGAALAVARHGKIVHARGFGYADVEKHEAVQPNSLFRIASISKPFTAVAILQLRERKKFKLEDAAFGDLGFTPRLETGGSVDPRLAQITIAHLLHHTGGFDRAASFDPMFKSIDIARSFDIKPPAMQRQIIEYMMGRPLDFDPGTRMKYSNFGYCVLGRIVEKASGDAYDAYVQKQVLAPLGIRRMRLGRTRERAPGEVHYYPLGDRRGLSVFGDGEQVPLAYGAWWIEAMDSHGGWLASAPELVRFASAFDDAEHCAILKSQSIAQMFARPKETIQPDAKRDANVWYACGWQVRPAGAGVNTWHSGLLSGTSSLLVCRHDGLTWAILFNRDLTKDRKVLSSLVDPLIHAAANSVRSWPEGKEFEDAN